MRLKTPRRLFFPLLGIALALVSTAPAQEADTRQPQFTFGLLADVQYGDKDTRGTRHYRDSLPSLKKAVAKLNALDPAFTIQLGDLIDGNASKELTLEDMKRILAVYNTLQMPSYHVVGNHCLNAGKEAVRNYVEHDQLYYDVSVPEAPGWRFVVLNCNDAGYGVLGETQIEWLKTTLTAASAKGERVIVFNHFAVLRAAAQHHRMKSPEPLRSILVESGCVAAYVAGHDHNGGYALDEGIHHVTLKGMVDQPKNNAFALVEVYEDRLNLIGFGDQPSMILPLAAKQDRK